MSKSLAFEWDPIDQPAAIDPLERLTWCALRIRVDHRLISRVYDRSIQSERTSLYVPLFPVAEWFVHHWWPLLNEVSPSEGLPRSPLSPGQMRWIQRHCLRSADSSSMLPALYLFHDGRSAHAEWTADPSGSMPNMPAEFVSEGSEPIDTYAFSESAAEFINFCLDRVSLIDDPRVHRMRNRWQAIQSADAEERRFCEVVGTMGLDPYDRSQVTDDLARFLEEKAAETGDELLRDLTELASPAFIEPQWQWLEAVSNEFQLGPNLMQQPFAVPQENLSPPQFGYQLARKVRDAAKVNMNSPIDSMESLAANIIQGPVRFEDRNHVPGEGLRAVVGCSSSGEFVIAGPSPTRPDNRRFLRARGLYHALVTTQKSRRLVTDAFSWDQKASRAFAAELIAPQHALVKRIPTNVVDETLLKSLSREFNASTIVIEKQLQNAGISRSDD